MRSKGSEGLPKRCQEEVPDGTLVGALLRKRKSLKTTTVSNGIAVFRMPGELKRYQNAAKTVLKRLQQGTLWDTWVPERS